MLLVADAHLTDHHPAREDFFAMLERIGRTDEDLVLLGDILDLWIGLPGHGTETGQCLLDWCRRERPRRRLGLVEGNHEFYVGASHPECFGFWSPREWREGGLLFAHGDLANRRDWGYRLLRLATKNPLARLFFSHAPGRVALARKIKRSLGEAGRLREKHLPEEAVRAYADRWFARGVRRLFLAHFHREYRYQDGEGRLCLLVPPWQGTGKLLRYDQASDHAEVIPWQDIGP